MVSIIIIIIIIIIILSYIYINSSLLYEVNDELLFESYAVGANIRIRNGSIQTPGCSQQRISVVNHHWHFGCQCG